MSNAFILLLTLFLLSLGIRTSYEILKEKKRINPENKFIFAIIFSAMTVLWISWFNLCPLDPFKVTLPLLIQLSGFILSAIGLVLFIVALVQLRGLENIDHLVTSGLYAKLRHPMYTSFILWLVGFSLYKGGLMSMAAGVICVVNVLYWRRNEEKKLIEFYGEIYQNYRKSTWF